MVRTQPMDKADPLHESKLNRPHSFKEKSEEPSKPTPAESKLDDAEESKPRPKELPYVVASAPIAPLGNNAHAKALYGSKARLYQPGETVYLSPAMARHYVKKKLLDPYIPDDDD